MSLFKSLRNSKKMLTSIIPKYWEGWSERDDGRKVTDKEVAEYVTSHMRIIDRLNIRKVVEATIISHLILMDDWDDHPFKDEKGMFSWKD